MRSANLLNRIETEAMEGDVVKALRLCLSLGGRTSSSTLRDWASQELDGYRGGEIPPYRIITAPLAIDGRTINSIVSGQPISSIALPEFARDVISEQLPLAMSLPGLAELVADALKSESSVRLGSPGSGEVVAYMNMKSDEFTHIDTLYWKVARSALQEVIESIRSKLIGLVAEMRAGMSGDEALPSSLVADNAVSVVIHGDENKVSVKNSANRTSIRVRARTTRAGGRVRWCSSIRRASGGG